MIIRVLIAEDQRLLRQCFREALELDSEIEVVATAADGKEAVVAAERFRPDIVLMDVSMPNMDGVAATNLIRERVPAAKVLMLSLHDSPDMVGRAVKAGIVGFVSKDVDLEELVRIIKAVHRGDRLHSPFLADQRLSEELDAQRLGLTQREIQVLKCLAEGENNSEIADKLCVSEQTIKKELASLFEKLDVKNRTQAAVRGFQLGILGAEGETA